MTDMITGFADAESDLFSCAAFLAERIRSADGHSEAIKRVVSGYLRRNNVDFAAQFADTIRDNLTRDRVLCDVAEKCAELDDDEYAFQLSEAIEDENFRAVALEKIAFQKAAMDQLEKAREIVAKLDHPSETLAEISSHEFKRGDFAQSLETISHIDFPPVKVRALQTFGLHAFDSGDAEKSADYLLKAVEACDEIEYREEKIRALHSLATSFIHTKRNDSAINVLAKAKDIAEPLDNVHRDNLLALISADFLRAGSIELADRTLDLIGDKVQIAITLIAFAQDYALKNENAEALSALDEGHAILMSQKDREVRDSRERFDVLATIAVRYAETGNLERAIAVANENPSEISRNQALIEMAKVCALKDDVALKNVIEEIPSPLEKTTALIAAASQKLVKGASEDAMPLLGDAHAASETVEQVSARCESLGQIGLGFLLAGEAARGREVLREALKMVATIRDDVERVNALVSLSQIFERAGITLDAEDLDELKKLVRDAG